MVRGSSVLSQEEVLDPGQPPRGPLQGRLHILRVSIMESGPQTKHLQASDSRTLSCPQWPRNGLGGGGILSSWGQKEFFPASPIATKSINGGWWNMQLLPGSAAMALVLRGRAILLSPGVGGTFGSSWMCLLVVTT